jgi:phosphoribosyl 1,2-cyclic phosphodiesterase
LKYLPPGLPPFFLFLRPMSLHITSLNSGSNGNCYYIGNAAEAVLIDAGISCRETERRMLELGLLMTSVKAIFVSHEHSDHITGVPGISKKYQLPVYITPATLIAARIPVETQLVQSFTAHQPVTIGGLSVTAFPKLHDAVDPHSFMVSGNGVNIGIFTDIGLCCAQVKKYFNQCNAAFLESNYCDEMLSKGGYPAFLKQRISGDDGHLSNTQALKLFCSQRSPQLSRLILSHLSKNNNSPELVDKIFTAEAGNTNITVASRYAATPVFCIEKTTEDITVKKRVIQKTVKGKTQLSLF